MTLYTTDFNGERIEENANLESIPHPSIKNWKLANFGDCWIKLGDLKHVEINDAGNAVIEGIECRIRKPGTHPGRGYWIDTIDGVMVPDDSVLEVKGIEGDELVVSFLCNEYRLALLKDGDGKVLAHGNGYCPSTSDLYTDAAEYFGNEWDYSQVDGPINEYLNSIEGE